MSLKLDSWEKSLLQPDAKIQDAIRNLDESALQIILVADHNGKLTGTITDGDIRRALLRGLNLDSPIDSIIFRTPMVAPKELSQEMVLDLMRMNKIRQLPIIDSELRIIGLHIWEQLVTPTQRDNVMVIMAGGRGRRLLPFTDNCPKPMLPISGKPMLEHIIDRAKTAGFRRFLLSIHYLGHMVEEYFGDGSRWQIKIDYLREEQPLGTAGALSLIDPQPEHPFLVTNGDVMTEVNYADMLDFHAHHNATATMAIRQHEWQHPFGVVRTEGLQIIGFDEKPVHRTHVNAGIYVLDPSVLTSLKPGANCDMPALFESLQQQGKETIAYPMHEPWLDVGRPDDLNTAREESRKREFHD